MGGGGAKVSAISGDDASIQGDRKRKDPSVVGGVGSPTSTSQSNKCQVGPQPARPFSKPVLMLP